MKNFVDKWLATSFMMTIMLAPIELTLNGMSLQSIHAQITAFIDTNAWRDLISGALEQTSELRGNLVLSQFAPFWRSICPLRVPRNTPCSAMLSLLRGSRLMSVHVERMRPHTTQILTAHRSIHSFARCSSNHA